LSTTYNAVDAVKWLQEKLSIPQKGIYDSVTKDAVTQYQTDQSLTVTGIPDTDTINKLLL
jgi:peptidoglycan hydrolase-like protein with peptidoglycan-binding domain